MNTIDARKLKKKSILVCVPVPVDIYNYIINKQHEIRVTTVEKLPLATLALDLLKKGYDKEISDLNKKNS